MVPPMCRTAGATFLPCILILLSDFLPCAPHGGARAAERTLGKCPENDFPQRAAVRRAARGHAHPSSPRGRGGTYGRRGTGRSRRAGRRRGAHGALPRRPAPQGTHGNTKPARTPLGRSGAFLRPVFPGLSYSSGLFPFFPARPRAFPHSFPAGAETGRSVSLRRAAASAARRKPAPSGSVRMILPEVCHDPIHLSLRRLLLRFPLLHI